MKPKRSPKQVSFVKLRTRKLYDNLLYRKSVCIIRDNETYVKYDYKTLPGDQFYTVKDGQSVDKAETSIFTEKIGKKAVVRQAICDCDMLSQPFVTTNTMMSDVYIKECLDHRILPMIQKHDGPVLFLPDLAAVHYSRDSLA